MTREYIESLDKIIDSNGCWIPDRRPDPNEYVRVTINHTRYVLSRLSMAVHYGVDYFDDKVTTLHKCNNPTCFNPEHLRPGSHSENMIDSVKAGTHFNASKDVCPKCGGVYITYRNNGIRTQPITRRCLKCKRARRNELRKVKNEGK